MFLRFVRTVGVLALFAGCGTQVGNGRPMDGGTDAGPAPTAAELTFEGDSELGLVFGETAELRFRYREADGAPIGGATLDFALDGSAHDSTLAQIDALTDADGYATATIIAGSTAAAFRVRASAERAAPLFVDVAISDTGFGTLVVDVGYGGERSVARLGVDAFASQGCDAALAPDATADRSALLELDAEDVPFFGLPAEIPYAVVVRGLGADDTTLARGCVDDVLVDADSESRIEVTVDDLDLLVEGGYAAQVRIDSRATATTLSEWVRSVGLSAIEGVGGGAHLLLDSVEAQLRSVGDFTTVDAIALDRATADLETELDRRLRAVEVGPSVAVNEVADMFALRTERIDLSGTLVVTPGGEPLSLFVIEQVTAGSSDGVAPLVMLDLAAFGPPPVAAVTASLDAATDTITMSRLDIDMPLGSIARATLAAVALERGFESVDDIMLSVGGCEALETLARERPSLSACDGECIATSCDLAFATVMTILQLSLDEVNFTRSSMHLNGELDLADDDGDLIVERIAGGSLVGSWTGVTSLEDDELAGSFEATRTALIP